MLECYQRSNSLDPDEDRRSVGACLGPNGLQRPKFATSKARGMFTTKEGSNESRLA